MSSDLQIRTEQVKTKDAISVFHLSGWLDQDGEVMLVDSAQKEFDQGARFLLLDLAGVVTLTSAGMRAIQRIHRLYTPADASPASARLKLCNAAPQVYQVLAMTGFLENIPNYESSQAAIEAFHP